MHLLGNLQLPPFHDVHIGRCLVYGSERFPFDDPRSGVLVGGTVFATLLVVLVTWGNTAVIAESAATWSTSWQCLQGVATFTPWFAMYTW